MRSSKAAKMYIYKKISFALLFGDYMEKNLNVSKSNEWHEILRWIFVPPRTISGIYHVKHKALQNQDSFYPSSLNIKAMEVNIFFYDCFHF